MSQFRLAKWCRNEQLMYSAVFFLRNSKQDRWTVWNSAKPELTLVIWSVNNPDLNNTKRFTDLIKKYYSWKFIDTLEIYCCLIREESGHLYFICFLFVHSELILTGHKNSTVAIQSVSGNETSKQLRFGKKSSVAPQMLTKFSKLESAEVNKHVLCSMEISECIKLINWVKLTVANY